VSDALAPGLGGLAPPAGSLDGLGYRGKVCVVSAAASGMGEQVAVILHELGAVVHTVDIAEPVVARASHTAMDQGSPASVSAALETLRAIGPVDYLFPCIGVPPHTVGAVGCMAINWIGHRHFVEGLIPQLRDGGAIATISSVAGRNWRENLAERQQLLALADSAEARAWCEANPDKLRNSYGVSKEMINVWALALAPELGKRGIRIVVTAPCPVDTAFMASQFTVSGREMFDAYPYPLLGRMATAREQAWSLVLLASPLNAAVTGAILATDQGYEGGIATGQIEDYTATLARQAAARNA